MRRLFAFALVLSSLLIAPRSSVRAEFAESLVRAPALRPPEVASVAGAYAKAAFGPADLARGTFALPGPFVLPAERGEPGIALTPSYAPENGLGEWGLGWSVRLEIRRFRAVGELAFDAHDDLDTPWGRAVRGDDGIYYMHGLSSRMLIREVKGDLIATGPDGTRFSFTRAAGIEGPRGTYQWSLVRVESVLGDLTTLNWEKNRFGRPLLRSVSYGGRGALPAQVEVRYEYESVDALLVDYRAERLTRLAERVHTVEVRARHAQRQTFELRWYYALSYQEDPAGPAFYLERVQRRYPSGAVEPAFRYDYERGFQSAAALVPRTTRELDGVLSALGRSALMPEYAARVDVNADGVSELEHHAGHDQLAFDGTALALAPLPRDGREDALCRPARANTNAVRTLLRLRPDDAEPCVIHLLPRATDTELRVCDRGGHLLTQATLAGSFNLSDPNLTVGDVNRDGRPDLVRVFGAGYQLIINESDAQGYRFRVLPAQRIEGALSPAGAFARDMNGDGQVDLVVRYAGGLGVLFGQGHLSFSRQPFTMSFRSAAGTPFSPSGYSFTFFDGNRDGLEDLLLASGSVVLLFANRGREFVEQPAPALRTLGGSGYPFVDDLTGSGELTLYHVAQSSVARVELTRAGSGLLTKADDGKGTRIAFKYGRKAPEPESYGAPVVLTELIQKVSGEDTVTHRYAFEEPVLHPVTHALIGYRKVSREEPLRTEFVELHHDPEVSSMLLHGTERAEGESLQRFVHREYEERSFHGVRYWRGRREERGVSSLDGALALGQESRSHAFEAELCPGEMTATNAHGSMRQVRVRAHPVQLSEAWHCLVERETWTGSGPDGTPQFVHALAVTHDERGQPTSVRALGAGEEVELQTLTYDTDHRLSTLTEAGKGTSIFGYDPSTGLLRSVVSSEAVESGVSAFDPVTDAVLRMERDRGGRPLVADYRFDGRERLRALWDSGTGTNEQSPSIVFTYQDPTGEQPGIVARTLGLGPGQGSLRVAEYFTASGALLAKAVVGTDARARENLTFSESRIDHRASGMLTGHAPEPVSMAVLGVLEVGYGALREGPALETRTVNGFGEARSITRVVQQGVEQSLVSSRVLTADGVLTTTTENGAFVTSELRDVDGRVLARTDEEGLTTRMVYDALGRLTQVTLASGEVQAVGYDDLGRLSHVHRDGIGQTTYHYLFGTLLLEEKTIADDFARVERSVLYQRDHAGRVFEERHTLADGGAEETLRYEYDGKVDGVVRYPGQRGHLTRVVGPEFEKRFVYDSADRLERSEVHFRGFRSVVETASYFANGAERSRTTEVRDEAGELLEAVRQVFHYDQYGRPQSHEVNGQVLVTTHYGDRGEIERVTGPAGATYYHYDAQTGRERGITYTTPGSATDLGWEFDARGNVESEDYGLDEAPTRTRTYGYSERGLLTSVEDGLASEGYDYDAEGRRRSARDLRGAFEQVRSDGVITLGASTYRYDTLGRLCARQGPGGGVTEYHYGPRGQLEHVYLPTAELSFAYDHEGQRVLKRRDGVPVAAYVGEAYLDAEHLVLPVKVGARVLGLLVAGRFEPVATDLRGSVVRVSGRTSVPSAYGVRAARLSHAAALDYAARGYDAELGFVRMGVRDYDPELGEFVTPDPLFLEALERCAESPVECNLYGYARGNPLLFVDPTGKNILPPQIEQELEAGARDLALSAEQAAYEARRAALTALGRQLLASADGRGQVDLRIKDSLDLPDPRKPGATLGKVGWELSAAGRLVASTAGMRFEGTIVLAGELELKMVHPAFVGAKAFGRLEGEAGRVGFNLRSADAEIVLPSVALSGGLRWDKDFKVGKHIEAKARAEVGIVGRIGWGADGERSLTAYGRARAEAAIGNLRRRNELNAALRLYDARAAAP